MRKAEEVADRKCPICGKMENQVNAGKIVREAKGAFVKNAKNTTPCTQKHGNIRKPFANRQLKLFMQAQAVEEWGNFLDAAKPMCITRLKKAMQTKRKKETQTDVKTAEVDELYWFLERKFQTKTRKNVYIKTMVSRKPRQIMGYMVGRDKSSKTIQQRVDVAPEMNTDCTDGYSRYFDVIFSGKHIYNIHNKKDTFTVESVNADLRRYIPVLRRQNRCFCRKLETLRAVVELFVQAYNAFGMAKRKF